MTNAKPATKRTTEFHVGDAMKNIIVRLPADEAAEFRGLANKESRSASGQARYLIHQWVAQQKRLQEIPTFGEMK